MCHSFLDFSLQQQQQWQQQQQDPEQQQQIVVVWLMFWFPNCLLSLSVAVTGISDVVVVVGSQRGTLRATVCWIFVNLS